ncbi:enoyl-CoA hydratase/isomerase family protein [Oryzibacter oryziterrae]|uniref:enoyl-CoA hydratase/isomerase family protein n=1 Tax=Oryzibacter oryziterrae TaxID=2766474 RepID=UPI001F25777C|nr:enoyl-CoA hydratase/isomerase family protein [Oryzibacter oryziterrae]
MSDPHGTAEEPRLLSDVRDGVAIATLNRPRKLNALDQAAIAALDAWVTATEANRDIRVAILTGAGDRAFSSGGDIKAWAGLDPVSFGRDWIREGHRVFDRLARLRQPLIVVLNGPAFGGGLELAATADLIVAEEQAEIGLPETSLGMVPGWSGTQRLVRRFGSRTVKRMALAGKMFSADEAALEGLVDEICAAGTGLERALQLAGDICRRGPVAVEVAKALINAAEGEEQSAALEALAGAFIATTADLQEGVAGFREKRAPKFEGR